MRIVLFSYMLSFSFQVQTQIRLVASTEQRMQEATASAQPDGQGPIATKMMRRRATLDQTQNKKGQATDLWQSSAFACKFPTLQLVSASRT